MVGDVEDHTCLAHHLVKRRGGRLQSTDGPSPVDVRVVTEVSRTHDAQSSIPPELHIVWVRNGIGAFHRQDVIDRRGFRRVLPSCHCFLKIRQSEYGFDLTAIHHRLIVGEVTAAHGHCLLLSAHAIKALVWRPRFDARHDRTENDPDAAASKFGERHRANAAIQFVRHLR